jgi:hypothetical protein
MSDQELAVQAIREAQHILEEYLEPRHHDNESLLDRLVEVLERPSVLVAVDRLRRGVKHEPAQIVDLRGRRLKDLP